MLQDLGNLGDFVGGLAVVATLMYLAVSWILAQPGLVQWWNKHKDAFAPDFIHLIDSQVSQGRPAA